MKSTSRPEAKAGIFSRLTFAWVSELVSFGYRHRINEGDVWLLDSDEEAKHWQQQYTQLRKADPSLSFQATLIRLARPQLLLSALFMAIAAACQLATPILLRYLVIAVQNQD